MKKKAVGYIRVSTEQQADEGYSLEHQAEKITQYAELNDLELVDIKQDAGISGKSMNGRPGIEAALDMITGGKVHHLIVYKLDRLARSTFETLEISRKLEKKGGRSALCIRENRHSQLTR